MAKKNTGSTKLGEFKLINVHFNDKERSEFGAWFSQYNREIEDAILSVVDGGFKVSVSYDAYNDSYVVALTAKSPVNRALKNTVYVSRHRDLTKVLVLGDYLFTVLLDGGQQPLKDQSTDLDW